MHRHEGKNVRTAYFHSLIPMPRRQKPYVIMPATPTRYHPGRKPLAGRLRYMRASISSWRGRWSPEGAGPKIDMIEMV